MQLATSCTGCLAEMQPSVLVASVQHFGGAADKSPCRLRIGCWSWRVSYVALPSRLTAR